MTQQAWLFSKLRLTYKEHFEKLGLGFSSMKKAWAWKKLTRSSTSLVLLQRPVCHNCGIFEALNWFNETEIKITEIKNKNTSARFHLELWSAKLWFNVKIEASVYRWYTKLEIEQEWSLGSGSKAHGKNEPYYEPRALSLGRQSCNQFFASKIQLIIRFWQQKFAASVRFSEWLAVQ